MKYVVIIGIALVAAGLIYMVPPQRAYEVEYTDAEHAAVKCFSGKYPAVKYSGTTVEIMCKLENKYDQ